MIHERWKKRLDLIHVVSKTFEHPVYFLETLDTIDWNTTLLFIDYQFSNDTSQTGLDIIKKYNLFNYSILVTGRNDEINVIAGCDQRCIKLLSKI